MVPTDPHPPGVYRMAAPSRHERGFFEAFGIQAGNPMWLDEKDRVAIWYAPVEIRVRCSLIMWCQRGQASLKDGNAGF